MGEDELESVSGGLGKEAVGEVSPETLSLRALIHLSILEILARIRCKCVETDMYQGLGGVSKKLGGLGGKLG